MKPITEKVLKAGLIDKSVARMLEKMGLIQDGAANKVKEDALKNASMEVLQEFADEVSSLLEKEDTSSEVKETVLDFMALKGPFSMLISSGDKTIRKAEAMLDDLDRYYFKFKDHKKSDFSPGNFIRRSTDTEGSTTREMITGHQIIYIDDKPTSYLVSIERE